ncbi:MAG TPA: terminase family protein [Armatimonadota bacterium]|jgi:phage FluMu gp28-like protein
MAKRNGLTADEVIASAVRSSGYTLTDYQQRFLADRSRFRAVLKARQTGFSWLFALEALAEAVAYGRFSIFVSLNREEAAEKILYAMDLYESLPARMRPRLTLSGVREIRFANRGRLLSFPCRSPRGRSGANIYLDEMAFYPNSQRLYTGAIPVITHGGRITAASTPNGDIGAFFRVTSDPLIAAHYSQHVVPWWDAPWLCNDVEAARQDPDADTDRRVGVYGTDVLIAIRETLDLEAFQQEYELRFVDSNDAFISWPLIEANANDIPLAGTWAALAAVPGRLFVGVDVGRVANATEIVVLREERDRHTVCCIRTMVNATFEQQENAIMDCLAVPGVKMACIDATGIGCELGERIMAQCPERVVPVTFTAAGKERMASALKRDLERGTLTIPRNRSLMDQIQSLRRTVRESGIPCYDAPVKDGAHADKLWALALALQATKCGPALINVKVLS